jgi:ADP-heptose:LPS heptosyltransferase
MAGLLDLGELAALLERSNLLISNNSGPVHLACAVGTPVVDIYALTNPQHAPWQVPHRVLSHDVPCKYCYKSTCPHGHNDCLRGVAPGQVVEAALELLAERKGGEPLERFSAPLVFHNHLPA